MTYLFPLGLPLSSLQQLSPNERVCSLDGYTYKSVDSSVFPFSHAQKFNNLANHTPHVPIIQVTLLQFHDFVLSCGWGLIPPMAEK